jgi:hypothetical protein
MYDCEYEIENRRRFIMKKPLTVSLTFNDGQESFIRAYAKIFGSNPAYVAMNYIAQGIMRDIGTELLSKAQSEMAFAKHLTKSKGDS